MNKLKPYSIEDQRKIAQAGKFSLIDFSIITNRKYKPNWHHEIISEKLEAIERGELKRLMIFMPPRSGKSQLATINFPAWYLGRNPDKEIITVSYSGDLAIDFGSKTRDLISNEIYQMIFEVSLKEDEKSKGKWMTKQGGSYISAGVGGAITGRGADCLILDDPIKNKEEAESEVYRNKIYDFFTSTAYTRLNPQGAIIIILTRWHLDDLAGRLLTQNKGEWEIIEFPAIATEDEEYRKKGEPLWPSRYSLEDLNNIKKAIGGYDWACLYQQKPVLTENQEFRPHWIKYRTLTEIKQFETKNYLTIDTAISQRASADYTGICRNFIDKENNWNLKTGRYKIDPKGLIELLFSLHEQDKYEKIGIEKTIYLTAIKPFLMDEMRRRNIFLPIVELEHKEIAKEIRIRGLIPRYESGSVYHIKDECVELEEEMFTFPRGMNDDVLDATAYQLQIAKAPMGKTGFLGDYQPQKQLAPNTLGISLSDIAERQAESPDDWKY